MPILTFAASNNVFGALRVRFKENIVLFVEFN